MPTKLTKSIARETDSAVFDSGRVREITVVIEPVRDGALIGFRLKGTRDVYKLPVGSLFTRAVEHHTAKIEKLARRIRKDERLPIRTARARARKELAKELR